MPNKSYEHRSSPYTQALHEECLRAALVCNRSAQRLDIGNRSSCIAVRGRLRRSLENTTASALPVANTHKASRHARRNLHHRDPRGLLTTIRFSDPRILEWKSHQTLLITRKSQANGVWKSTDPLCARARKCLEAAIVWNSAPRLKISSRKQIVYWTSQHQLAETPNLFDCRKVECNKFSGSLCG